MEKIDEGMEKRVWQRVHGIWQGVNLQGMAAAEQNLAAVYLSLAQIYQNKNRQLLQRLHERERNHGYCINGISRVRDGKQMKIQTVKPSVERPETVLRKCYAQTLQALQTYRQMEADGEFGHIFRTLRQQEEENCVLLLQILGR